jgi:hypothetical protein
LLDRFASLIEHARLLRRLFRRRFLGWLRRRRALRFSPFAECLSFRCARLTFGVRRRNNAAAFFGEVVHRARDALALTIRVNRHVRVIAALFGRVHHRAADLALFVEGMNHSIRRVVADIHQTHGAFRRVDRRVLRRVLQRLDGRRNARD